jgi:hypothetical protein
MKCANQIELKPCPFCGSRNVKISEDDTDHARWVFCTECQCDGPCIDYKIAKECSKVESLRIVVDGWNLRSGN